MFSLYLTFYQRCSNGILRCRHLKISIRERRLNKIQLKQAKRKGKLFLLKEAVKQRFKSYIEELLQDHNISELVLVIDQYSLKLISNLLKISEIVGIGITYVERLELKRKVLEDLQALYIIEPQEDSIKLVINDFKERRQYRKLHLLFPYAIKKDNLKLLSLEPNLIKYLAKHSIKEFFHSLYFTDQNVFTLRIQYLKYAFSDFGSGRQRNLRNKIAERFTQIFRSFGQFYQANLYFYKGASGLGQHIATAIQQKYEEMVGVMHKNKTIVLSQDAEDIDVFIIDRSIDSMTPFLHDLHYEPMLFDLLNMELEYFEQVSKQNKEKGSNQQNKTEQPQKSQASVKSKPKKKKQTDDISDNQEVKSKKSKKSTKSKDRSQMNQDSEQELQAPSKKVLPKRLVLPKGLNQISGPIYDKYRYSHIAQLMTSIPEDILNLKESVQNVKIEEATQIDMSIAKQYEVNQALVRQCNRIFNENGIDKLALLQQSLATGIDENGAETSSVKLLAQVRELVSGKRMNDDDKLRLGLLTLCCICLSEQDFKAMMDLFPSEEHCAFTNLVWLGVSLNANVKRSTKNIRDNLRKIALEKMQKTNMHFNRYSSVIELIMPIIINGMMNGVAIDEGMFGLLVANPNEKSEMRKLQLKTEQKKRKKLLMEEPKSRKKLVIFFVGGISFSEVRALRQLQKFGYYDIIIGADEILTPQTYARSIQRMREHA